MDERSFAECLESATERFRASYGLGPEDIWTDALIDQALSDHHLPTLATLPDRPVGIMATMLEWDTRKTLPDDPPGTWRKVNAMHLIVHVLMHDSQRCTTCASWR